MSRRIIPVSTLVHYLKGSLESDPVLHGVLVEGEISNLRKPYSGHWYFSLKDEKSSISCVMFSAYNRKLTFPVNNGDKVEIRGDVSVYEAGGSLQIMVNAMRQAGIGDLYQRFEALKKKLSEEGLFDPSHKKPLPLFPMDIAVVTGNNTAAREDVMITLKKRWPCAKISEYPAPVQGMEASIKIIEALSKADCGGHQVILLVRGGGSIEDLWCFNDESLARFIYSMHTPVVTGIGHEIDFTLCDFVADVRANTPTGAVETAVPDRNEVRAMLKQYKVRMVSAITSLLNRERIHLDHLSTASVLTDPDRFTQMHVMTLRHQYQRLLRFPSVISENRMQLMGLNHRFETAAAACVSSIRNRIDEKQDLLMKWQKDVIDEKQDILVNKKQLLVEHMQKQISAMNDRMKMNSALLDAYSPLKILSRGYSVVIKDTIPIKDADMLEKDDEISIRLFKGNVSAKVVEVIHGDKDNI